MPHCLLGEALLWDLPEPHTDRAAYELALKSESERVRAAKDFGAAPADEFDLEARRPRGQTAPY